MKKSILIPFLFMGLLAFASCKGTSENKSTTATDTVQAEKPQSGTIHLTRAEFLKKIADYENHSKEWKYLGDKPAIVDFYADWCGPCKMMGPVVEKCAEAYAGKMKIGKLNVDDNMAIAQKYRVVSIPHFIVFKNGEPAVTFGGAMSEADFCRKLDQALM